VVKTKSIAKRKVIKRVMLVGIESQLKEYV